VLKINHKQNENIISLQLKNSEQAHDSFKTIKVKSKENENY